MRPHPAVVDLANMSLPQDEEEAEAVEVVTAEEVLTKTGAADLVEAVMKAEAEVLAGLAGAMPALGLVAVTVETIVAAGRRNLEILAGDKSYLSRLVVSLVEF